MIIAMDASRSLFISGEGDLLTSDDEVLAVGSGAPFALAAARAAVDESRLGARQIMQRSLEIAAEICIYTNAPLVWWNCDARFNASSSRRSIRPLYRRAKEGQARACRWQLPCATAGVRSR